MSIRLLAFTVAATLCSTALVHAAAPVTRCGWVVNPTPSNWWLTDSAGEWIMMAQGADEGAEGMDLIGDLSAGDYKATNGDYGYACGCMKVATDAKAMRITRIFSFKQLPLSKCSADPKLPPPE